VDDGHLFTGKVELGQVIETAAAQVAAEELDVGFERVRMVTADTDRTPDECYTSARSTRPKSTL
jgi:nicotinate dehydrogenase subunit B